MRCNEPLRLDRSDVDLANGVLTIRGTKFGKSRYVPVHPSTQQALQAYAMCRDRWCPSPISPRFFLSERGTAVTTLLRWYHDGIDVERHLPQLATYLGHSHITDTYWYLTATCSSSRRSCGWSSPNRTPCHERHQDLPCSPGDVLHG
jgi:integrase